MRIALVEPNLSGHHKVYLDVFYDELCALGHSVDIYTTHLSIDKQCCCIKYDRVHSLPKNQIYKKLIVFLNSFITLKNLCTVRRRLSTDIDLVFFCCIDDYMNELISVKLFDIVFPVRFSGLFLSPRNSGRYFQLDRRNILRSKYCDSIAVLDEFCIDTMKVYQSNVVLFPDFADSSAPDKHYEVANSILEKAQGRKIISILGAMSFRKGIYTFVEAAKRMPSDSYYFVMAGKTYMSSEELRYVLDNFSHRINCFYYGENIPTEADFNRLIEISDVIYAAYVDFSQSSNMFAKASLFAKPLIVSKGYYMEEVIKKYSLGVAIRQDSVNECIDAVVNLSIWHCSQKGYQEYLSRNSREHLFYAFEKLLSFSGK